MATPIDGLLPLLWLASPALPVGGFSYSEGLEAAVDAGLVTGEADAAHWLAQQLELTLARAELVIVRSAMIAWREGDLEGVKRLDGWVLCTRETFELRLQTVQMGRSMIDWLRTVRPEAAARAEAPLTWPIAWSLAASSFEVELSDALNAFAFGWAENMVQAAVRAVPLGQGAGQRILSRLAAAIPSSVDASMGRDAPQVFCPMLAILSSRHEHQYSRLFRS
jgi:urease accessory protein